MDDVHTQAGLSKPVFNRLTVWQTALAMAEGFLDSALYGRVGTTQHADERAHFIYAWHGCNEAAVALVSQVFAKGSGTGDIADNLGGEMRPIMTGMLAHVRDTTGKTRRDIDHLVTFPRNHRQGHYDATQASYHETEDSTTMTPPFAAFCKQENRDLRVIVSAMREYVHARLYGLKP